MEWSPSYATEAYLHTLKLCRNSKRHSHYSRKKVEPESKELLSAMAAGMNAKIILEVTLSVSPLTVALAAAAWQTKGRLICILPEPSLTESRLLIKESGVADFVDFVTGDPAEVLLHYTKIDFAVIDCRIKNYQGILRQLDVNHRRAVIVANNLGRGEKGLDENVKCVKDDNKVSVKSMKQFLGKGMEVMTVGTSDNEGLYRKFWTGRRGQERTRRHNAMRKKSQWVKKVDEASGEEHIFRVV